MTKQKSDQHSLLEFLGINSFRSKQHSLRSMLDLDFFFLSLMVAAITTNLTSTTQVSILGFPSRGGLQKGAEEREVFT